MWAALPWAGIASVAHKGKQKGRVGDRAGERTRSKDE